MGFFSGAATSFEADVGKLAPTLAEFAEGCGFRNDAGDTAAGTTLRVCEVELDCTEVLVSGAGFVCAGAFVCGRAFPCGCEGELVTGSEATEASTFVAAPVWAPPDCCWMNHQPPPAITMTMVATAAIHMPLPHLPGLLSSTLGSSSRGSALPNVGSGNSGICCFLMAMPVSAANSSTTTGCSDMRFAFSFSMTSCVEEGAAALRASGLSHAGILSSSSSRVDIAGAITDFAGSTGFVGTWTGSGAL